MDSRTSTRMNTMTPMARRWLVVMAVPTLWTAARALPVVDVLSSSAELPAPVIAP